jgi:hypothetical protein
MTKSSISVQDTRDSPPIRGFEGASPHGTMDHASAERRSLLTSRIDSQERASWPEHGLSGHVRPLLMGWRMEMASIWDATAWQPRLKSTPHIADTWGSDASKMH